MQILHNKQTKLKSEIFNNKKSLSTKLFFFAITKNLNWEILTKNLVTFKRWDGVKGSLKNPIFKGFHEKPIYKWELPKKRWLGQFADLRMGEGETWVDTPMHTMRCTPALIQSPI